MFDLWADRQSLKTTEQERQHFSHSHTIWDRRQVGKKEVVYFGKKEEMLNEEMILSEMINYVQQQPYHF